MVLSTIGFSFSHTIVRHLSPDIHSFQIVFFRGLIGVLVVSPWLFHYGFTYFATKRFGLHLFRTFLTITSISCFYYALAVIPLAKATAIGFLAPILCSALVIVFLHEATRAVHWWAMAMGVLGILIILRPGVLELDTGTLLMVVSTVLFAFNLLVMKLLSRTESSVVITGYTIVMLVPLSLPMAIPVWVWPDGSQLFWLVLMGLLNGLSLLCFTQSMKEAQTSVVMPLDFLRMVWMTVIGFVLFAEEPDSYTWIGGVLIFAGALLIAFIERREPRRPPP
jgi:drug/metabolite transporter (DMT)-like permease